LENIQETFYIYVSAIIGRRNNFICVDHSAPQGAIKWPLDVGEVCKSGTVLRSCSRRSIIRKY